MQGARLQSDAAFVKGVPRNTFYSGTSSVYQEAENLDQGNELWDLAEIESKH